MKKPKQQKEDPTNPEPQFTDFLDLRMLTEIELKQVTGGGEIGNWSTHPDTGV
jgi:hypothetical protein